MVKKIIIACVCFLLTAIIAVVILVVLWSQNNAGVSEDMPESDDSFASAADEQIQDDRFQLYKTYYYDNYQTSDAVCLLDLTHDGENEMLVLRVPEHAANWDQEDNYLRVYTVRDDAVELIYEQSIAYNRVGWYLTETSGESNIVYVFHGVWQGEGSYMCDEFYLTEEGEPVYVNQVEKVVHFNDPDNDMIFEQYEAELTELYGESFENITLLVSTITEEKIQSELSAEITFGPAQDAGSSDDRDNRDDQDDQNDRDDGDSRDNGPDTSGGVPSEFREQDLNLLKRIVSPLCEFRIYYDCEEDLFLDVFYQSSFFGWSSGMEAYGLLKDGSTYKSVDYPEQGAATDPLGLLDGYGYYAIREDVLNEYKEKVFCNYYPMKTEPRKDENGNCQYYYLDGWYYFRKEIGGSETSIEFASWEQTNRGTYLIHVDTIEYGVDRTEDAVVLEVTTLEKGEILYWNIYRVIPA